MQPPHTHIHNSLATAAAAAPTALPVLLEPQHPANHQTAPHHQSVAVLRINFRPIIGQALWAVTHTRAKQPIAESGGRRGGGQKWCGERDGREREWERTERFVGEKRRWKREGRSGQITVILHAAEKSTNSNNKPKILVSPAPPTAPPSALLSGAYRGIEL